MLDRVDYNIPHKISISKNNLAPKVQFYHRTFLSLSIDGSGGGEDTTDTCPHLGPIFFIFKQFLAKLLPNNRFSPQSYGLAPPRLGNPGSPLFPVFSIQITS